MKKLIVYSFAIASFAAITSCGDNQEGSVDAAKDQNEQKFDNSMSDSVNNTEKDRDFLVEAASGGMMEVELGKLAATNASSASVKKFGQQMVDDHSKANDELKQLAASKNITIPSTPGEKHQEHINDLKAKKGADFDKAYMDLMVSDHKEDIDAFQKEADNGNDADIKTFAAGKVPVLQGHLSMAETTKNQLQ